MVLSCLLGLLREEREKNKDLIVESQHNVVGGVRLAMFASQIEKSEFHSVLLKEEDPD